MSSASARLEALRLAELRRLRGDLGRLALAVGQTGKTLVERHPLAVLASAGVVGVLVARRVVRPREAETASGRSGHAPLVGAIGGFLRTSLLSVLSTALREVSRPGVEQQSPVESEVE